MLREENKSLGRRLVECWVDFLGREERRLDKHLLAQLREDWFCLQHSNRSNDFLIAFPALLIKVFVLGKVYAILCRLNVHKLDSSQQKAKAWHVGGGGHQKEETSEGSHGQAASWHTLYSHAVADISAQLCSWSWTLRVKAQANSFHFQISGGLEHI